MTRPRPVVPVLALLLAACDLSTPSSQTGFQFNGRVERGGTLRLRAFQSDTLVPGTVPEWSVQPSTVLRLDSVTTEGAWLTGLQVGNAVVEMRLSGRRVSRTLLVREPPFVVVSAEVGGDRELVRVRVDGTDYRRLTTLPGDDRDPVANVAFQRLLWSRTVDGRGELWTAGLDGTNPALLLADAGASLVAPAQPRFFPQLAYQRDSAGSSKVWLAAVDGATRQRVSATAPDVLERGPAYTADGQLLAWLEEAPGAPPRILANAGLGSPISPLRTGPPAGPPRIGPDNAYYVFAAAEAGARSRLWLFRSRGSVFGAVTPATVASVEPGMFLDGRVPYVEVDDAGTRTLRVFDPDLPSAVRTVPLPAGVTQPATPTGDQ